MGALGLQGKVDSAMSVRQTGRLDTRNGSIVVGALAVAMSVIVVIGYWEPNVFLDGDGVYYYNVAKGLIENGTLRQEGNTSETWYRNLGWNFQVRPEWSNIALGARGEWWPKHPILLSIAVAPFVWAFGVKGALVFANLMLWCLALLAYRLATRLAPGQLSLAAGLMFVVTPWIYWYAHKFTNDVFYTVLVLAAFDATFAKRPRMAGLYLGLSVMAKVTNVLYGPALLAVWLWNRDRRAILRFLAAAAIPVLVLCLQNLWMFGGPFTTGYDRIIMRGHDGVIGLYSHRVDFTLVGLWSRLVNVLTAKEYVYGNFPFYFIALVCAVILIVRRRMVGWVFAWSLVVPVVFHAAYTFYRLDFTLPQFGLSMAPFAAAVGGLIRFDEAPAEPPKPWSRAVWLRIVGVAAVVLLVCGVVRVLLPAHKNLLWENIFEAKVYMGERPCDDMRHNAERWACGVMQEFKPMMTGRVLTNPLTFDKRPRDMILLVPPATPNMPRSIIYPNMRLGDRLLVEYGLSDDSVGGSRLRFKMSIDDEEMISEDIDRIGLRQVRLDTSRWRSREVPLRFEVSTPVPNVMRFGISATVEK